MVSRAPSRSSESEGWSGGPAPYGPGPPALDVHHGDLLPIPQLGARPPHVELTQGRFATEARRDLRQAGWVDNLARLASHLAPHFREPHGLAGPYRTLRGDGPRRSWAGVWPRNAELCGSGGGLGECQSCAMEQVLILAVGAFPAAGEDQHRGVQA